MQLNWRIAVNYDQRGSRKDFSRGEVDLGDFRIRLSVLRRELQFEVEVGAGKSYVHRKLSKLILCKRAS